MTEASEWSAARGDKWRTHLGGMEAMLAPVDDPLIDALEVGAPLRIADIGCGGGGTSFELAKRAPYGCTVHGFDIAAGSIAAARQRAQAEGVPLVFETADIARSLPRDAPYDRLVSRFGTMFFSDPPAAFANIARWLVPGGRFAFAVWGPLSDNAWMTMVRDTVAETVDVPKGEPDAPGPFRYANADTMRALLEGVGFRGVATKTWHGKIPVGGNLAAPEAASFALAAFATFADLLAAAGGDARERTHRALTSRFEAHAKDGAVRLSASVHIVTGARAQ